MGTRPACAAGELALEHAVAAIAVGRPARAARGRGRAQFTSRSRSALFGSTRPTAADLTAAREAAIYERLGRGESAHVVLYAGNKPAEVVFYGYSWD